MKDRKDLADQTRDLQAESVSILADGRAKESEVVTKQDKHEAPSIAMDQARFDALLSVGVFDLDKSVDWRNAMEKKVSDRFAALSSDRSDNGKDRRALWFEAAKQAQQDGIANKPVVEQTMQDRSQKEERQQTNEFRRVMAMAR